MTGESDRYKIPSITSKRLDLTPNLLQTAIDFDPEPSLIGIFL